MSPERLSVLLLLGTSAGGVGRHVAALAAGLARGDQDVIVAGPADTDQRFGFGAAGARFVPVELGAAPHLARDARAVGRVRALLPGVDVVHAHGVRAGALAVLAGRSRLRPPPVVVTLHNSVPAGRGAAVHRVLERVVARGAAAVLGVSTDLVARQRRLGARRVGRALVPAPPRDPVTGSARDVRIGLGVAEDVALLVTVARLAPQKGVGVLIEALARLAARPGTPPAVAVVAGDGPLAEPLRRQAERDGVQVRFVGHRADVPDLLAAADLVVLPSLWEGQPLIAQEALRAGAALIATDAGGTAEVTRDAAWLIPPGDPEALATALATLLADPARRDRLGRLAAARAAALPTDDEAAAQVLEVYRRVTRGVGRGG